MHLPTEPSPPFGFYRDRLLLRLAQLDGRWVLKRMEGCSFRFSFTDGDKEITLAHLLGAELWVVHSVRRQASNEMCWMDLELAGLKDQEIALEARRLSQGESPELLRGIYNVERTKASVKTSRKILQAFYMLSGDIQKLVTPLEAAL